MQQRIASIDTVRGLVMVIMALDHVRDLLHTPALTQDPTDLSTTTAPLFFTRLVTHLCAPTFVFLSGTSVYVALLKDAAVREAGSAARSLAGRNQFLRKRGLVLIGLELTLINFAFWTDIQFRSLLLQVIFAIGCGLIILSWLTRFRVRSVLMIGLLIICLHDLLLLVPPFTNPAARLGWALLFRTDVLTIGSRLTVLVGYALVPWLGILLFGYGCGPLFTRAIQQRRRYFGQVGVGLLLLFVGLRLLNGYGDAAPWSVQQSPLFTALSFLNVSKYPPSLAYTALTLGLMFLLLAATDGLQNRFTRWLGVYGKVPLFYYLIHWYLAKAAMIVMFLGQGYSFRDMPIGPLNFGRPVGSGVSLPVVYAAWLAIVLLLYPLCRWYGRYKISHPQVRWIQYV